MKRNIIKLVAGVLILATGYLLLDTTFAACTLMPDGFICNNGESCELVGGCMCEISMIANGATCTFGDPGGGVVGPTPISYAEMCTNAVGCTCNGFNVPQGEICMSDGAPTILAMNGQCQDRDGCLCNGPLIASGAMCTTFVDSTPPNLTAGGVTNTNTSTPSFSFTSNEAGTISYSGSCSSSTTAASAGSNTITFNTLSNGTYSDCQLRVTDEAFNTSARLNIPTFTVAYSAPSGGGGGGGSSRDYCPYGDISGSYYDNKCTATGSGTNLTGNILSGALFTGTIKYSTYSGERNDAYLFAKALGITTAPNILKADMKGILLRKDLAKMISVYAIQILKKTPNTGLNCIFGDMYNETKETRYYAKLACQLGLMGLGRDGKPAKYFNPDQTVSRAIFGTTLSRALRGDTFNNYDTFYQDHFFALKTKGIITTIDPYMKEVRGYVMLMMLRSANLVK